MEATIIRANRKSNEIHVFTSGGWSSFFPKIKLETKKDVLAFIFSMKLNVAESCDFEFTENKKYDKQVVIQFGGRYSTFNTFPGKERALEILNNFEKEGVKASEFFLSSETNPCLVRLTTPGNQGWMRKLKSGEYPKTSEELIMMTKEYFVGNRVTTFASYEEIYNLIKG